MTRVMSSACRCKAAARLTSTQSFPPTSAPATRSCIRSWAKTTSWCALPDTLVSIAASTLLSPLASREHGHPWETWMAMPPVQASCMLSVLNHDPRNVSGRKCLAVCTAHTRMRSGHAMSDTIGLMDASAPMCPLASRSELEAESRVIALYTGAVIHVCLLSNSGCSRKCTMACSASISWRHAWQRACSAARQCASRTRSSRSCS